MGYGLLAMESGCMRTTSSFTSPSLSGRTGSELETNAIPRSSLSFEALNSLLANHVHWCYYEALLLLFFPCLGLDTHDAAGLDSIDPLAFTP